MMTWKSVLRGAAVAAFVLSSFASPAFAAKASDPEPQKICFAFMGHVICVPVS